MIDVITDDFRHALEAFPDSHFDCVIADPPYGVTSLTWDRWIPDWPDAVAPKLKPTGSMWVFGSMRMFLDHIGEFGAWRMSHDVVWEKHNGSGFDNDRFRRVHEHALHFYLAGERWTDVWKQPQVSHDATARRVRSKGGPPHWGGGRPSSYVSVDGGPRLMRSVMAVRSEHGRALHPTQKPIGIIEPLLRYSCPPEGHVLDPFAGAGSVGVAAKLCGRKATLVEVNPVYAQAARERLQAQPQPLFVET